MKTYKISLAVLVPQNYEIQIEAKTEKEAIEKAIEDFENGQGMGKDVEYGATATGDFDIEDNSGICVEDVEW